jgi:hypothetical protein
VYNAHLKDPIDRFSYFQEIALSVLRDSSPITASVIPVPPEVSSLRMIQIGVTSVRLERIKIKKAKLVVLSVEKGRTKTRQEVQNVNNAHQTVMKTIVWNATNVWYHKPTYRPFTLK